MATVANGTGKRRALKKRPDTNERTRQSIDTENPVKVKLETGNFITKNSNSNIS